MINLEKDHEKIAVRKLKDMKGSYLNQKAVKKMLSKSNPVLYKVFIKKITKELEFGLTVINSGNIAGEYYMTKGHVHIKPSAEVYALLEGKGKLVMQNSREAKVMELKKDRMFIVPEHYSHRLVNSGRGKLKVLTIYESNTGHNYNVKFRKRVFNR